MSRSPDTAQLTREERETLRTLYQSRRPRAAEARLKQTFQRALLELQTKLNSMARPSGDQ